MLITPRTFKLAQRPDRDSVHADSRFLQDWSGWSWHDGLEAGKNRGKMLLVHQNGNVKVGELVRYTLTYTPSADRILPHPSRLHVKIKNNAAIPLRAAYLRGPYTLHVAAYPATFNPNKRVEFPTRDGVPEFEPNLKAGGSWTIQLVVPENVRDEQNAGASVTWIIEVTSQILFSDSASISFELLVARDEKSLEMGFTTEAVHVQGGHGSVRDQQQSKQHKGNIKGVYSKAVALVIDDVQSLWNKPALPAPVTERLSRKSTGDGNQTTDATTNPPSSKRKKKIHLVILTHGLHGNCGADLLYLKESIDATAKQAREDAKEQRRRDRSGKANGTTNGSQQSGSGTSTAPLSGGQEDLVSNNDDVDDTEEVVVRGFHGNVIRTEKGIQYLGKRLAKYVLELTYPDQPYLPSKRTVSQRLSDTFSKDHSSNTAVHDGSSVHRREKNNEKSCYQYTSISFVGHSLGGIVQTYAIAYIHKHSPNFFERIQPINFIAIASPLLGLSNENPIYVKFALDFGLVGRTGQDLGLFWHTPTFARTGWSAMIGGLGPRGPKQNQKEDPSAKPLLRILPTGPAHQVLRKFRNRTLYSNVVNDGIVPLRTSCLLFLDWRGLGRVEKARRENGLIGTMTSWGWAELTGQNSSSANQSKLAVPNDDAQHLSGGTNTPTKQGRGDDVPQPPEGITDRDDQRETAEQFVRQRNEDPGLKWRESSNPMVMPFSGLLSFLRPSDNPTATDFKMYRRSQTIKVGPGDEVENLAQSSNPSSNGRGGASNRTGATRGYSFSEDPDNVHTPPKTTVFESAGHLLSPPIPSTMWIIDPASRDRTIFHDRIYHPEDIPKPPPPKKPNTPEPHPSESTPLAPQRSSVEPSGMRVEEKIARAYHRDLSWRKVLVRLEPDAHNNIIVRRMFANAYGWPVVKHLCDTHFAHTYTATTRDENEPATDRAKTGPDFIGDEGEEVRGQREQQPPERSPSEMREAADELAPLKASSVDEPRPGSSRHDLDREDSAQWDDSYFGTTDDEDNDGTLLTQTSHDDLSDESDRLHSRHLRTTSELSSTTKESDIAERLTQSPGPVDGHRGLETMFLQHEIHTSGSGTQDAHPSAEGSKSMPDTTALGLQKSPEHAVGSPSDESGQKNRSGNQSLTQKVAQLSMTKETDQQ